MRVTWAYSHVLFFREGVVSVRPRWCRVREGVALGAWVLGQKRKWWLDRWRVLFWISVLITRQTIIDVFSWVWKLVVYLALVLWKGCTILEKDLAQ